MLCSRAVTPARPLVLARTPFAIAVGAASRFARHRGFVLAGALAFSVASCLAPMILVLLSVAGYLLEREEIAERIFDAAVLAFPGYGREAADIVGTLIAERRLTGIVGTAGLAIFATPLFSLLRTIINDAFGVERRRGRIRGFLFDIGIVAIVGTGWTAVVVGLVALRWVGDLLRDQPGLRWLASPTARDVGFTVLTYAIGVVTLLFLYRAFPNTRVPATAALVAAVVVVGLWELARTAFGSYVAVFGVYGRMYGSLGIVVASLVWLYYSMTLLVFGAELAAVCAGVDDGDPDTG